MSKKTRILLVEDDTNLGFLLVDFLESSGFDVKLYRDGEAGLTAYQNGEYDFCILDIMMPKMDGFKLAETIRSTDKQIPIIMLTARTMDEDKIRGFNIGIDDYVTKPFNHDELVCRIKAILARVNAVPSVEKIVDDEYAIGSYQFECKNQLLKGKEERRLTKTESDILKVLCNSMNNVVSRTELMETVWGEDDYFIGRSLDVFISKLRKYFAEDPSIKIESIPRVGLILSTK